MPRVSTAEVNSRRERILQWVAADVSVSVADLASELGVSTMTIRRDLEALAREGRLQRVRGGARTGEASTAGAIRSRLVNPPDVLILNPMDARMARALVQDAAQRRPIVIAESIPFPGVATLVAIDSYRAGLSLGIWVGKYAVEQMGSSARVLFVGLPSFSDTAERGRGFFDGLTSVIPRPDFTLAINGRGLRPQSRDVALAALSIHPDINIIIGVNDQAALGVLDALHELRRPVENVLLGTFGLEGVAGKRLLTQDCPRSVGVAMFPEFIGRVCADVAVKAYNGLPLPPQVVTPTAVVTAATLPRFYDLSGPRPELRWAAVVALPDSDWTPEAALLDPAAVSRLPRRIDFVRYLHDEYYDQLVEGLQERTAELGISLRVTDASADLAASIDLMRRAIGKAAAALVKPNEAVILDAGTTNAYLAQELAKRTDARFTVITNSVPVIEALAHAEHVTLVALGGILHRPSQSFLGAQGSDPLGGLRVDKAFLGGTGVSVEHGISNPYLAEADFKRAMIAAAKEVILVADSFKIGEISLVRVAPITAIHRLVTDDQISSQDRLALTQAGVEVVLATAQP
jgi:DeoR/GlpR family transcriptional regulator of sugar metabolism/DNA-binding LacI/PurR family transcriptional regulator